VIKRLLLWLFTAQSDADGFYEAQSTEAPSTTLAKMMALTILQELPTPDYFRQDFRCRMTTSKFMVEFDYDQGRWTFRTSSFNSVSFSNRDKNILVRSFEQYLKLRDRKDKLLAEEKSQRAAVDVISQWMGVSDAAVSS